MGGDPPPALRWSPTGLQLTLYGRGYCHLCEDMANALRALGLTFVEVDVDADPALEARLGDKVPVLTAGVGQAEIEICHYFLDVVRLREVLTAIR